MTCCPACADPLSGRVIAGCRGCQLRDIALGPWFMESARCGRITEKYALQLRAIGADIECIHQEVKRLAKTIHLGATA